MLGRPRRSRQRRMRKHRLRGRKGLRKERVEGTDRQLHMCQDWNGDTAILLGTKKVSDDLENSTIMEGGTKKQNPPAVSSNP